MRTTLTLIALILATGCSNEQPPAPENIILVPEQPAPEIVVVVETPEESDPCLEQESFMVDADGDGWGNPANIVSQSVCDPLQPGYLPVFWPFLDCDDGNTTVFPGAPELCDGLDNDCNGIDDIHEPGLADSFYYEDADGDGFGDPSSTPQCIPSGFIPPGTAINADDCDDSDPSINPDAEELLDGIDQDCGIDQCEFVHNTWANNGDVTRTNITISRMGPDHVTIYPGESALLTLRVSNENCDWASVDGMSFSLTALGNGPWIESVEDDAIPMEMQTSSGYSYTDEGYNIIEPYGEQLFYPYDLDQPIWLPPGEEVLITFRFTNTEGLVSGDYFSLGAQLGWLDFASGVSVPESTYPNMGLTVDVL